MSHHVEEPLFGLRFGEDTPHTGQARTRGTVITTSDGILSVRAYTVPGHRWLTALRPEARRTAQRFPGTDAPPGPRHYSHRWPVCMHKVDQWFPSLGRHKIRWRGPYIQGPADAPLKVNT